jgi:hypothetical protein
MSDISQPLKTRRGVALYKNNPFVVKDILSRRITNTPGDMALVLQNGEKVADVAGFWQYEEVDSTKFVKLFVSGVRALKELTSAGAKVFEVLYTKIQESPNSERVYISFASVDQTLSPMSAKTYQRGMGELVSKGFIAGTPEQGWYWLNPAYIWNGDRLAFMKEYRRKKPPKDLD